MMRVIAIGRARDEPEAALFARYVTRIRPALTLTELPDGKGAPTETKRREGEALLAALPAAAFAIALDLAARPWTARPSPCGWTVGWDWRARSAF